MLGTLMRRTWNPWDELGTMRRVCDDSLHERNTATPASTDHWVKDDVAHVILELPAVAKDSVDIAIEGTTLTVSGERKAIEAGEGDKWHRRERWHGKFDRTYKLPFNVEQGKVKATFKDGVLNIDLPRAEAEKPKKITISAK